VVFGTADYLSPEQARGQSATPRSDVYALGVTLYEMLTGRLPFTGDSSIAVAMQHLNGEPPPPRQYNPRIPPQLEALVLRALSKEADERPATAREFAQLLRTYRDAVEQETVARPRVSSAPDGRAVAAPEALRSSPARVATTAGRQGAIDGLPPRTPLPPPRRAASEPPPSRGTGFGGFLIGLLLLAGVVGLVYLAAIGTFNDLFSLVTGAPGVRPPRPTVVVPTEPGPTAPSQVPVPSLVGLDRQQAIQMLTAAQLLFVEAPARYSTTITSGLVLDQAPQAGALITATDVVTFAVSLGPDTPEVPAVRGLRPEVARSRLAALGFQVEVVEEASTDMSAGFVIRTEPAPPARPLRGDTVTMFVSVGNKVQMPDVTGLPEAEADQLIRNAGLFVSWVDRQGPNQIPNFASIPEGTVVSSLPAGGAWVNRDTGVTLGVRGPNS
jgi:serine/threonine-protein kinase